MLRVCGGKNHVLQDEWIRVTKNPTNTFPYPKTGDFIGISNHPLLDSGKYLVTMVTEYEPAFNKDLDGRDIRITLIENKTGLEYPEKNGQDILKAMMK